MVVDQKAAEKSRRLSKNGSVSTQTERKRTAYGKQGLQSIQFTNGGSRAYLKCRKAYDIMPVGKKDVSAHVARKKPRRSQLRGFLRATMSTFVFLAYWHYSICLSAFQVCPTSTTYKPYALQVLSLGCSPLLFPEGCFLSILRQSSPCLVSLVELCPCPHSLFQG